MNEASGDLQPIEEPVPLVIIDVGRKVAALGRGEVIRMLHGKVEHLITRLTHHLPLLKEDGLGTSLHEKELVGKEHLHGNDSWIRRWAGASRGERWGNSRPRTSPAA